MEEKGAFEESDLIGRPALERNSSTLEEEEKATRFKRALDWVVDVQGSGKKETLSKTELQLVDLDGTGEEFLEIFDLASVHVADAEMKNLLVFQKGRNSFADFFPVHQYIRPVEQKGIDMVDAKAG